MKTIKWADPERKEIIVREDSIIEKRVTLENLKRDLELCKNQVLTSQREADRISAEIKEIEQALGVSS